MTIASSIKITKLQCYIILDSLVIELILFSLLYFDKRRRMLVLSRRRHLTLRIYSNIQSFMKLMACQRHPVTTCAVTEENRHMWPAIFLIVGLLHAYTIYIFKLIIL